ncbi:MAG: hemerythrin domain-containing protein [Planctomycetia bacterium]|nr:hemerythrin domain-containing protein [Planctomycetia bacterium]
MQETAAAFAEELGHEHASLLKQLEELETMTAGSTVSAAGVLIESLRAVRAALHRHFLFEEKGGYMNHVLANAPQLHRRTEELLAEHTHIGRSVEELIGNAAAASPGAPISAEVCEQVRQWVKLVRGHEAGENKLVMEACCGDIGEED